VRQVVLYHKNINDCLSIGIFLLAACCRKPATWLGAKVHQDEIRQRELHSRKSLTGVHRRNDVLTVNFEQVRDEL
jgi:hypothetical protein